MKQIALLGSTGSIGRQTLEIVDLYPDLFRVYSLAAANNLDILIPQIKKYRPIVVSVADADVGKQLVGRLLKESFINYMPEVVYGDEGLEKCVKAKEVDMVVLAIVGFAGMKAGLKSLEYKKPLALANKESLVSAGKLFVEASLKNNVPIIPIDSEHSAIFQCLFGEKIGSVANLIITSSGGALRDKPMSEIGKARIADVLNHPNWSMGPKITVDSATLMNKVLEIVEAKYLFGIDYDKIEVRLHPQSIVHSMVRFNDGSIKAQLSKPDMRLPIGLAMFYPERMPSSPVYTDLGADITNLSFSMVDEERYPIMRLAKKVFSMPEIYTTVLNAANEVAVERFLAGKIYFDYIHTTCEIVVNNYKGSTELTFENIIEADRVARELANNCMCGT